MKDKVVMALSGGMDSATMLAILLYEGHEVECLGFTYGSKHNAYETEAAKKIAEYYEVPYHLIDLTSAMKTFKSNLLKTGGDIPEGNYNEACMELTVVPARNMVFLSILAGHAWSVNANKIAVGIHKGDHAIYADCRKKFYKAMDAAIYLGTDNRVEVIAPLIDMDKTKILNNGIPINVPYELTRTCYKDQPEPCGKCGSCRERIEAFENVGLLDPVKYQNS